MPNLGGWEFVILIGILVLLFGAKRLPDMARSIGQSARVFKGEMKGMKNDDEAEPTRRPQPADPPAPRRRRRRCRRRPQPAGARRRAVSRVPAGLRAAAPAPVDPARWPGSRSVGRRRPKNPDGTMSLVEHLYELRNRLTIALVAIVVTTVFGYIWYDVAVLRPAQPRRAAQGARTARCRRRRARCSPPTDSCTLLGTGPFDQFTCASRSAPPPASCWPARSGSTSSGRSSPPACTPRSGATR